MTALAAVEQAQAAHDGREPAPAELAKSPAKPKKGTREIFSEVLGSRVTRAKVQRLLDIALDSEITVDAQCPECGHDGLKAKAPDVKKALDVITAMLEQAEGRPEQRAPGALSVTIVRPSYDVAV